ncbi:hypothetical protein V6Z12_D07G166000 [Gossypium hirsutum]
MQRSFPCCCSHGFPGQRTRSSYDPKVNRWNIRHLEDMLEINTVKKVVYTSSITAVFFNKIKNVEIMDESYWSDVDYIRSEVKSNLSSYAITKTLTEKAVLEFAAQHGLDLVSIIPPMVLGPFICPKLHVPVHTALSPILGSRKNNNLLLNLAIVHMDDLARAFIFLLEHPEAKGSTLEGIEGAK